MRSNAALVILVCALFAKAALTQEPARARKAEILHADLAQTAAQVIALTNAFRHSEKLASVQPDAQLLQAARYFADFMARSGKYGHSADGSTPPARIAKFGYEYCTVSENIAYQFSSAGFSTSQLAQLLVEGWQKSPRHRRNMLDPNVADTAVAVAQSAETGRYYAVQLFARPKSATIQFSVANRSDVAVEYAVNDQVFPLSPRVTRTHHLCRPPVVALQGKTVEPRHGQALVISNDDGGLNLRVK